MHEPTVLVVEDDLELLDLLVRGLREEGFRAVAASSGRDALERAPANRPDALVIDIGLPDADGRDLCQALRAQGVSAPVLFLTARERSGADPVIDAADTRPDPTRHVVERGERAVKLTPTEFRLLAAPAALRRKLREIGTTRTINTAHRVGYALD